MKKEPFLKMSRREKISWQKRLMIRIAALILSLLVCAGVIFLLVRMNPFDVYKAICGWSAWIRAPYLDHYS